MSMAKGLVAAGTGVTLVGGLIALARYGRSRFSKECSAAWSLAPDAPAACALDAGDYGWLTAVGMGLRAITGGNVYSNMIPPGTPPSRLYAGQPPGQIVPPGQAGNIVTTTSGN